MVELSVNNPLYPETKDSVNSYDDAHNIELKTIKMSISVLLPSAILLIVGSSIFLSYPITFADQKIVDNELHKFVGYVMWFHYVMLLFTSVILFRKSYGFMHKMQTRADEINISANARIELLQSLSDRATELESKNPESTT